MDYMSRSTASVVNDVWAGTTDYQSGVRIFATSGVTDSTGRITFNLTKNGSVGGTAMFSQIIGVSAIGLDGSGTAIQAPMFIVESMTAVQVVIRAVRGTSIGVLIGGTIISAQFAGAGYTAFVTITGIVA